MFEVGRMLVDMQSPPALLQALFLEPAETRVVHVPGEPDVVVVLGFPSATWIVPDGVAEWFGQFFYDRAVATVYLTTWTPGGFKTFSAMIHRPKDNRIRFAHLVEV